MYLADYHVHSRISPDASASMQEMAEAAIRLGFQEIPTIDGKVKYTLPEGTQSGTTFRLKGKGIPSINGRGRGDQYVTVYIETPKNLNKEQKEALKKFAETMGESNYEEQKKFFKKFKK